MVRASHLSILLVSLQIYALTGTLVLAQAQAESAPNLRPALPTGSTAQSTPTTPAPNPAASPNPATVTNGGTTTNESGLTTPLPNDPSAGQFTAPGPLDQKDLPYDAAGEAARGSTDASVGAESLLTPAERARAKILQIDPIPMRELIPIGGGRLPPIKLEATYNQPIGVRQVLAIALENALPIKINKAGWDSTRYLYYAALGRFLPDYNMVWRIQRNYVNHGGFTDSNTLSSTVRFPVFQGGRIFFGSLVNYHRMKSAQYQYSASINDTLLNVYSLYNQLLLNQMLLQIRLRSVEVSRAQLRLNQQLKNAGTGTNFAVMQSTTQLALDRQALLQQQVTVRQSALNLAAALNMNVAINLMPLESQLVETRLIDPNLNIGQLTEIAVRNRPELGQFNQSRLAAVRQIQVQASNLMPTAQFFLSANRNQTERGGAGGGAAGATNLGSLIGTGAAGNGVGGSSVIGVGAGGIGGAGTGATTVIPAGGGGGAGIAVGGGGNNTNTSESFTMGFDINWNLQGLGVPDAMTTMSQRYLARQAMLQYNQTAINVLTQVRSSYLNTLTAEEQVDVTGEAVIAGREGLRLANLRLQHGVGTNLELIQAQRDYITALINQAQAIINFNISQAQLLHDIGQISLATLTTEINRPISHDPLQSKFFDPAKHSIN